MRALGEVAEGLGCSQAQLALAWCLQNKDVNSVVFGASRPEQMVDNLKAIEVAKRWSPQVEQAVLEIFKNQPKPR